METAKKKRIWMNHWFSTAVNIIELLRQDDPELQIIGTNENLYSVIRNYCDEWYQEPALEDEDYVEFCLDFCQSHEIGVFIPRRGLLAISRNKDRFENAGIRVMIDRYDMVSRLNNKADAYQFFKERRIGIVPEHYIVTTAGEFVDAYNELLLRYEQICFKFVNDEGGKSFRVIDEKRKGYAALFRKQNTRMTLDDVLSALREQDEFAQIMIMPFLSDDEVSVDCLNTKQGLITLPRIKGNEKYETIRYDQEILQMCEDFQQKTGLECPYNIQFKYLKGIPYFLEVNTRMSGGIHMSCYASGVNIPKIALCKLLGDDVEWHNDRKQAIVGQVMKPVTL